jgi:hypothetical protein
MKRDIHHSTYDTKEGGISVRAALLNDADFPGAFGACASAEQRSEHLKKVLKLKWKRNIRRHK